MVKLLLLLALTLKCFSAYDNNVGAPIPQPGPQTFLTGGGCASIPGVGSPILMIANAHKFIEDNLKIQNSYSNVRYVHYAESTTSVGMAKTNYKLAFAITDFNGVKYIAVDLDQSPFGIGSTKINKFLMTGDAARVKQFIDVNFNTRNTISCGDMKFVYSSYGNDPTAKHDYLFPGRNQNSAGLAVLNNLGSKGGDKSSDPKMGDSMNDKQKNCSTANAVFTENFFGAKTGTTPVPMMDCHPTKQTVASIIVGCSNNVVSSLQLSFNNVGDNGTHMSTFAGNPATPVSATTTIDLRAVNKITFTSFSTPATLMIKTLDDKNNVLTSFTCGTGMTGQKMHTILTADFLGFIDVEGSATGISFFDLVFYQPS